MHNSASSVNSPSTRLCPNTQIKFYKSTRVWELLSYLVKIILLLCREIVGLALVPKMVVLDSVCRGGTEQVVKRWGSRGWSCSRAGVRERQTSVDTQAQSHAVGPSARQSESRCRPAGTQEYGGRASWTMKWATFPLTPLPGCMSARLASELLAPVYLLVSVLRAWPWE